MSFSSYRSKSVGLLSKPTSLDFNLFNEHRGHKGRPSNFATNLPPSPAESMQENTEPADLMAREEERITRALDRGAPGDAAIFSSRKTAEQKALAKRKSQYYQGAFAQREANGSARERILKESVVMAEVRTNVIINDEYTFITDLSYHLSNRYQRSESSILVTVTHSSCVLFAGSFDPAYVLTISAVPSQVQPVTNKRNAMLLQRALEESLSVHPSRGIVIFTSIPEENFASNGKTVQGDIDDLERGTAEDTAIRRSLSRSESKAKKRNSTRSLRNVKTGKSQDSIPLAPQNEHLTPPLSGRATPPPIPGRLTEPSAMDKKTGGTQKVGRRKSFIQGLFGWSARERSSIE